jgi:hypothetical protein
VSVTRDSGSLVSVVVACSDHGEIAELLDALESQSAREIFYRQALERARLRAYHATRSELAAA